VGWPSSPPPSSASEHPPRGLTPTSEVSTDRGQVPAHERMLSVRQGPLLQDTTRTRRPRKSRARRERATATERAILCAWRIGRPNLRRGARQRLRERRRGGWVGRRNDEKIRAMKVR